MQQFKIGKTYYTRSIGDYDCIIRATITKRTEKTITTDKGKTFRVKVLDDVEQFMPWGNFSMCPSMQASKVQS